MYGLVRTRSRHDGNAPLVGHGLPVRDPGRLFHLYKPVYGDRVFFGVVQRRGGYDGFGNTNAPVRMAAHRHRRRQRAVR
jgi:4-hydroxyphenylpyruvate dioxygenase